MKLVIHPGWYKTGTSAVQSFFSSNYEQLIERKILYPKSGRFIDNAHHGLALSYQERTGITPDIKTSEEILSSISKEILDSKTEIVIVSSELSPVYLAHKSFCRFVKAHNFSVSLLFTIRPQRDILISLYKEIFKSAQNNFTGSMADVFADNCKHLSFLKTINEWRRYVSKDHIHIFRYSEQIINDFKAYFDIADIPHSTAKVNPSHSSLTTEIIKRSNMYLNFSNTEEKRLFHEFIGAACDSLSTSHLESDNNDISRIIDTFYKDENTALAHEYFQSEVLFDNNNQTPIKNPIALSDELIVNILYNIFQRYQAK